MQCSVLLPQEGCRGVELWPGYSVAAEIRTVVKYHQLKDATTEFLQSSDVQLTSAAFTINFDKLLQ